MPERLANKIAAGEVIERPASVVKELVENSIDAGAAHILIEVKYGGKSLIRITDDGCGLSPDDALLAFERHATSKIKEFSDIENIRTLGFRGEALPSIVSVSRFKLLTACSDAETGTEITFEGGKLIRAREALHKKGAVIEVRSLFFNVPARKKFMKTTLTEMSHITEAVVNMALGHPEVGFRLIHNDDAVLDFYYSQNLDERLASIIGHDVKQEMLEVEHNSSQMRLRGWISQPKNTRAGKRHQKFFLNGRYIRDKILSSALYSAYRGSMAEGRHPMAYLFLELPTNLVDVNVHPTKTEVRFWNSGEVHGIVSEAVKNALNQSIYRELQKNGDISLASRKRSSGRSEVADQVLKPQSAVSPLPFKSGYRSFPEKERENEVVPWVFHKGQNQKSQPEAQQQETPTKEFMPDLNLPRYIGQLNATFLVLADGSDLLLIDQHTAHERILFEKIKQAHSKGSIHMQRLLYPVTLELSTRDVQIMNRRLEDLRKFGFEIEPFGRNTFAVKTVPSLMPKKDIKKLILDMLDDLAELGKTSRTEVLYEGIMKSMACQGAVKAHSALDPSAVDALIKQLFITGNPAVCPHGRPIIMRIPEKDIMKYFKR